MKDNKQKEINFIGFLTGLRGDTDFQVQTNIKDITVGDYAEALAQIEANVILLMFKSGGINILAQAFAAKDTILMGLIKSIEGHEEDYGLSKEDYSNIKIFFGINEIEKKIEENKTSKRDEIIKAMNDNEDLDL